LTQSKSGVAGGEYPFWGRGEGKRCDLFSSLRDREVIEVKLGAQPAVVERIRLRGNPNKMILNHDQSKLYVAADNSDTVTVDSIRRQPQYWKDSDDGSGLATEERKGYTGSAPNDLQSR